MSIEATPSSPVESQVVVCAEFSLAMAENSIPLVPELLLTNTSDLPLTNLTVEVTVRPDFSSKWTAHISSIPPGGTFRISDIDLQLARDKLTNQLERSAADISLVVRREGIEAPILENSHRIDVLAYNEWSPIVVPQLLAAFVLPNHPAIAELLGEARGHLERLTGNPALNGYQSQSASRVAAIAESVYLAIQSKGITYSNPPASFEKIGQKIRTPDQVFREKLGTCLDISVLVAAALEQVGLNPIIVLVKGHAFAGVWLEQHFAPEAILDDAASLKKNNALGRLLVFDSSSNVARPTVSFGEAKRQALNCLDQIPLSYAVDIHGSRKQQFRPLPSRVAAGYQAVVEVPSSVPSSGPAGVPRPREGDGSGRSRPSAKTKHPRVEAWKQKLLDTSLRNRLLNFKDKKETLELLCDDLGPVEDLVASGDELRLHSRPTLLGGDDPRSKKLLEQRVADDALRLFLRERLDHGELFANQPTDKTDAKLTAIFRAAREALEETGTNTLCLTFGMLEWYESDSSEEPRRAPILLVPVTLQRNARTSGFVLRSSGEDARLNVTLFEKLRIERGITLPELSELPLDDAGVDVPAVLNRVREAILNVKRWEVKDELHLGLFSFAKFQMWSDLEQNLDVLLQSPVVNHLLNGKGDPYPNEGAFPEPSELDSKVPPADLICPLDADSSQLAAVAASSQGKTFVLQGPPGTGKSQTITNLITHCIAQGKRVLFVAEKAAALEVVQRRLAQVGLGPYVLELHSHKAGKLQVLEQFREALDAQPSSEPSAWEQETQALYGERQYLNAYVGALHKKGRAGFSVFDALGKLHGTSAAPLLALPAICCDSADRLRLLERAVGELRDALRTLGPVRQNAWLGCTIPDWRVDLPSLVTEALDDVSTALSASRASADALAVAMGASAPSTFDDVRTLAQVATALSQSPSHGEALLDATTWPQVEQQGQEITTLVRARRESLARLGATYTDALFKLDLSSLAARFRRHATSFALFAWWALRNARKLLRTVARTSELPNRRQIADDLDQAVSLGDVNSRLATLGSRAQEIYGSAWSGTDSDPGALDSALTWAKECRARIARARPGLLGAKLTTNRQLDGLATIALRDLERVTASLQALHALVGWKNASGNSTNEWDDHDQRDQGWRVALHQLRPWHDMITASLTLSSAGCRPLVDALTEAQIPVEQAMASFHRSVYQAWIRQALGGDPVLAKFEGESHHKRVSKFAELDAKLLSSSRHVARARVSARAPQVGASMTGGEMGVLQKELQKKRGHMPIRKLLANAPSLAARLKPCFLMSPMSVATYLDPKAPAFDIIVFDEASQIPAHDAIGTLARGRSAIVVGDTKQLPPTSFFQSGGDDDSPDDNDFEELESILNECVAAGMPERRLDWHYRSRHESLIAFSNHYYYKNRLNTFPSAAELGPGQGVSLKQVNGFYDKGGSRTNQAEAQALVSDLLARLRAPDAAKQTYGVVTFSQAQQKLVDDLLLKAVAADPSLEPFFNKDTNPEYVIVKNLENIQGDERDVVLFSICYGPDQTRKVSMNFGPLNRDGGERRLNVAVTRARQELVVYATIQPDQIDLARTNAVGVKHLKTFLDYARRGPIAISEALTVDGQDHFDSPFEEQVCERLRALGYTVHTQVGCAGYRIDMGLADPETPGRYILGVECDGAHYHSARSARERDRLRGQVLGGLGWRIHRIWSTDWWQAPDREIQRVKAAFDIAKADAKRPPRVDPPPPPPVQPTVPAMPVASTERTPSSRATPPRGRSVTSSPQTFARGAPEASGAVPYRVAPIPQARWVPDDVHSDAHRDELRRILLEVIDIEAPLSLRMLARRVSPLFNIQRTSSRLEDRLRSVLGRTVKIQSDVVWRADQDPAAYRDFRVAPAEARRDAQDVPVEEVANAAASVLRGSIALEGEELVKLTARVLGFARTGDRVAEHMSAGIAVLIKRGAARKEADKVVLL